MVAEHPSDAGVTDCHSPSGFAMTYFSLEFALILLQNVSKTTVIASQYAYWRGNPFPTMRSIVSAYRADNITPVNDNLSAKKNAPGRLDGGIVM